MARYRNDRSVFGIFKVGKQVQGFINAILSMGMARAQSGQKT
ncbi:hypothetical protein [Bacillus sp. WMMC1349]|nr:hypothetical protein [Bacillus sp. WMMC1349]